MIPDRVLPTVTDAIYSWPARAINQNLYLCPGVNFVSSNLFFTLAEWIFKN